MNDCDTGLNKSATQIININNKSQTDENTSFTIKIITINFENVTDVLKLYASTIMTYFVALMFI